MKAGYYDTIYGNGCEYDPEEYGEDFAYDLDMREIIPVEMVDFETRAEEIE